MRTPRQHLSGGSYDRASVTKVSALQRCTRFLIAHGVADDNVHFQHTLALVRKLQSANVKNFDTYIYPDADHSIGNALQVVFNGTVFPR